MSFFRISADSLESRSVCVYPLLLHGELFADEHRQPYFGAIGRTTNVRWQTYKRKRTLAGPSSICFWTSAYFLLPPLRPGLPGVPPSSSFERLGLPWFELPGSQPSGPLPTPWLQRCCGGLKVPPPQPVAATPVRVTAAFASARPTKVPPVMVIAAPARIVPLKSEVVMVAASATHQYTLHASAPLAMTTWKFVPVRAPVPLVPILKIQVSVEDPSSVNLPVSAASASKQ